MGGINKLEWIDLLVIVFYFIFTSAIGIWTIIKTKGTIDGVFLAGRSVTWWPIGLSIFASNIGSIHFIGMAGTAAASGVAVVHHEWNAIPLLILLGWVYLPVYIASGIYTVPEYLEKRFGGQRLRMYLSIIAILTYLFAIMSVDLYTGAVFIQQTIGLHLYTALAVVLGTTFLFTALGGLRTVLFTDAIAVCVMVIGGFTLFTVGLIKIGGFSNLKLKYLAAVPNTTIPNTTCGYPLDDSWHTFRDLGTSDYPWLGTLIRSIIGGLWYFCANQLIVQRALAAKTITHAKAACLLAGLMKLTPMVTMVLPGMMSRVLFADDVACATPEACMEICGNPQSCSNIAYPKIITELLPSGLRGLLIASVIAAVVSSLTSIFNSCSALVTIDLWQKIRPKASELELLIIGKLFILLLVVFAMIWIEIIAQAEGGLIYKYSVTVLGYFGSPTCAMFLIAIFWTRMTEPGAFYGMLAGQGWGLIRFVLDLAYTKPLCGEPDSRPWFLRNIHPFYYISSQMLITAIASILISYITKPIPSERLAGLTYFTRNEMPLEVKLSSKKEIVKEEQAMEESEAVTNKDMMEMVALDDTAKHKELEGGGEVQTAGGYTWKRLLLRMFKLSDAQTSGEFSELQAIEDYEKRMASLQESDTWRYILNSLAALLVALLVSLYIYFF